ncbi:MAG: DNA primase [Oscillospiraceae bacterium]|nr:DNA primase [Oscillospiraceae bacterium]
MTFPDAFLDELFARTDIVELISRYVPLKRLGSDYKGLCPFHSEKTPSFTVSPDKQLFYCFGCSTGGGVLQFVMRAENLDFAGAVHFLADRANLPVPEEGVDRDARRRRDTVYRLNRAAAHHFHEVLLSSAGEVGQAYCRARGLSQGAVTHFGLGYAPDRWDELIRAMTKAGFTKADLLEAGLAVRNKAGGLYDRFRGRLMFPIVDLRRQVVGFGGRVLDGSAPKYMNSPDTPVFSKSRQLFALNMAKNTKQGRLVLAEGYMDVVSLHQAGFDCAVASLGTALTDAQALLLAKYTKEVVLAYDMDAAGQSAARRAIEMLGQSGVSVKVLRLRDAKDPDEFLRRYGREALAALLAGSETQTEYSLSVLAARFDLAGDEGRLAFCREAAALLASLPSAAERDVYTRRAAEMCRVSFEALAADVRRERGRRARRADRELARRASQPERTIQPRAREMRYGNPRSASAEEEVVRMLFHDPSLSEMAAGLVTAEDFSVPLLGRIFALLCAWYREGRALAPHALDSHLTPDEMSHFVRLVSRPASLAHGVQALRDCAAVIAAERALRRAGPAGEDPLLVLQKVKYESQIS